MNQPELRPAARAPKKPVYTPHPTDYTPAEEQVLRDHFASAPRPQLLAALPGRSWISIRNAATRRGIVRKRRPQQSQWDGEPLAFLKEHYPLRGAKWVAAQLGRPVTAVHGAARRAKLFVDFAARVKPAKVYSPQELQARAERGAARRAARLETKRKRALAKQEKLALQLAKLARPAKAAKPVRPPKAAMLVPEPVKRSPLTPLLNARVEQRRRADKERDQLPKAYVTAEQLKKLPGGHPARMAWTRAAYHGPAAATEAFHQAMSQLKAA